MPQVSKSSLDEINDVIGFASAALDLVKRAMKLHLPDAYPYTYAYLDEAVHYLDLADLAARRVEKRLEN